MHPSLTQRSLPPAPEYETTCSLSSAICKYGNSIFTPGHRKRPGLITFMKNVLPFVPVDYAVQWFAGTWLKVCSQRIRHRNERYLRELVVGDAKHVSGLFLIGQMYRCPHSA